MQKCTNAKNAIKRCAHQAGPLSSLASTHSGTNMIYHIISYHIISPYIIIYHHISSYDISFARDHFCPGMGCSGAMVTSSRMDFQRPSNSCPKCSHHHHHIFLLNAFNLIRIHNSYKISSVLGGTRLHQPHAR